MGDTIGDELEALRRERPKPDTDPTAVLIDLFEALLSPETAMPVDEAIAAFKAGWDAYIDHRIGVWYRGNVW